MHILSFLPPNDRAINGRLACRDAADGLSGPQLCTASLSQPLPPHATPWAVEAGQQHMRQLPFRHKLQLLCRAAASGSEVNLEVALALLQPSIFPEVLQTHNSSWASQDSRPDPGKAAIKAGHPQLLGWCMRHCPGLLRPHSLLKAAARYCDLAGLQAVWDQLTLWTNGPSAIGHTPPVLGQQVLDAAAKSTTPDAVAKMEWVLAAAAAAASGFGGSSCCLGPSTAVAAVRSGDLGRLRWLQERGCPMDGESDVLESALQHADLAVAQWLVDEAGCELPAAGAEEYSSGWEDLTAASARSAVDGVGKLQWLQERGAPPLDVADSRILRCTAYAAVRAGQLEVAQHLLAVYGPRAVQDDQPIAMRLEHGVARSGSMAMLRHLHQAGLVFVHPTYTEEGELLAVGGVPARVDPLPIGWRLARVIEAWPDHDTSNSRDLREAVQLAVGEGWHDPLHYDGLNTGADAEYDEDGRAGRYMGTYFTYEVMTAAVRRGDLALVQYLTQVRPYQYHVCEQVVAAAAEAGCEALLEWIAGQPGWQEKRPDGGPYTEAAERGDLGTLTALRRLGVAWTPWDDLATAVRVGCCGQALRWLVEQGLPLGSEEEFLRDVSCALKRNRMSAKTGAWLRSLVGCGIQGKGSS